MDKTPRMTAQQYRNAVSCGGNIEQAFRNGQSSDRGRTFEQLLSKGCYYYSQIGAAVISKVPEPYICLKRFSENRFMGRFTGRAEPDYKGVLKGGQAIAFEAKSTSKTRIQRNALTLEQTKWLDAQMIMGAKTYVCVNIRDKFFMIPWRLWRDMKIEYGKKFLMPGDIPEYEVVFDGRQVRFLEYKNGGGVI